MPGIENVKLAEAKGKCGPAKIADRDGICRVAGAHLTGTQLSYLADQWATFLGEAHAVYRKTSHCETTLCANALRDLLRKPIRPYPRII